MMDSCLIVKQLRAESIVVDDLRRDLNSDLTEIAAAQDPVCVEKEHLQVYLRTRPFCPAEIENGESQDCVTIQPPDAVLLKAPRTSLSARMSDKSVPQTAQRFLFSQVYGPDSSQKDFFDGTVKSLVRDVLEGKNSLVFTYGVTNAGKTFTFLGPENDVGILPRSLDMIFSNLRGRIFTQMSVKPQRCQDVLRLTKEQQAEEAISKRNLFRLLKESDAQKTATSLLSSKTFEELAELDGSVPERSLSLDMDPHTKFSIWVSFCEIYNENIHDLLEQPSGNAARRTNLRLCQDIKGNAFIKDLRWVQVNSADEAFKVMKLGKKNQSISSTKLNQLSSRSHSIFAVRILRLEDVGIPRVLSVSELSLCDLAGSERCGKTQNKGDRLKEAGNINTSLLSLGKCINALKSSQQAKHHVPFRESKLTHYLQGYFTGRGKACMIVNINQCASMYDETLNVLKFSAVAQKVVVLTTTTAVPPLVVKRSAREVSFIINRASQRGSRRTSLLRWERSLEDVQEDADSEEEDEEDEDSIMDDTLQDPEDEGKETVLLDKEVYESQLLLLEELQSQLRTAKAENMTLEGRIREEVTKEFAELFSQMQSDYNERVSKERELMEERCERRLEIFKNLVGQTSRETLDDGGEEGKLQESEPPSLNGMLDSMSSDLAGIRQDAESARTCLVTSDLRPSATLRDLEKKVAELTDQLRETKSELTCRTQELDSKNSLSAELEDIKKTLESREQRVSDLMEICEQKDDMITKIQAALDQTVVDTTKNSTLIKELLQLKRDCTCLARRTEGRKRRPDAELHGPPPPKKGSLEDSAVPEDLVAEGLARVKGQLESSQAESRLKDRRIAELERERQTLEFRVLQMESQIEEQKRSHDNLLREKEKLAGEHIAIQRKAEELQQRSPEPNRIELSEIEERSLLIKNLELEVTRLKQEAEKFDFKELQLKHQECSSFREESEKKLKQELTKQKSEEKEAELLAKETALKQMEAELSQKEAELHQKEVEFSRKEAGQTDVMLSSKEAELAQKEVALAEKEGELSRMGAGQANTRLANKEAELAQKEAALAEKEAELSQKEVAFSQKQADLSQMGAQLSQKGAGHIDPKLADKEAELAKKEAELNALQKSLKEARSRLEEDELQAVQEARRREAERRRELLAVAEEAIAQKDAELQKKQEEINRLKEEAKRSVEKAQRLSVDLQRRVDDSADLKEKLADSKKQILQVQKEISSMREADRTLKQKLSELEKAKTQLQMELSSRERTIQQLRSERSSDSKTGDRVQLYEKALKDLQERERVIEDMRLALTEQEETQSQLDLELDDRDAQIQRLTQELENFKKMVLKQRNRGGSLPHHDLNISEDLKQAREEAAQAQESLKMAEEKHQTERKKWLEEKLLLIGQAKEAEERRNQDMRRYADDRERYARQNAEMESLTTQLAERDQEMERWRKERDTLVSALEVQMKKLISSVAEKDKQIQQLQSSNVPQPAEDFEALQALLREKEAQIHKLEEQLCKQLHREQESSRKSDAFDRRDSSTQTATVAFDDMFAGPMDSSTIRATKRSRGSVTSQASGSCPSVLDSSEISTDMGRRSRFPRPELEISFSPLQPDRFALKRQGDKSAVTVKISRSRKRKSAEMEKDGVETENKRNLRCKNTPKLAVHQEEEPKSPKLVAKYSHDSQSSLRGKKDGTFLKIGEFLNRSPTFLGTKAKKFMGLMSGKSPDNGGSSLKLKRPKRKVQRPEISSPMDIPAHQIIGGDREEKESEHQILKRRLRTKTLK